MMWRKTFCSCIILYILMNQVPGFSDLLEEMLACVEESKAALAKSRNVMMAEETKKDNHDKDLVEELTVQVNVEHDLSVSMMLLCLDVGLLTHPLPSFRLHDT